jgi:hypothetical protein
MQKLKAGAIQSGPDSFAVGDPNLAAIAYA